MLPEKVQTVLKCLPLLHGSSFLRETLTKQIMTDTFVNCPVELVNEYKEAMGITILFNDKVVSTGFQVAFIIISGIIFICVSAILQRRRNVMSR
jgi:multidrug/hemolysin transport system permease protein